MANTREHDMACVALFLAQGAAAVLLQQPYLVITAAGSLLGLLLSPDLDWDGIVVENTVTGRKYLKTEGRVNERECKVRNVWGAVTKRWPPGIRLWWKLYAKLCRHRHTSHAPWGTFVRLLWVGAPLLSFVVWWYTGYWQTVLLWWGLFMADLTHLVLDAGRT